MYAIVIWTMIGFANGFPVHDWRPLLSGQAAPKSLEACKRIAEKDLGYQPGQYKCVKLD